MTDDRPVDVLLVEDRLSDARLTLRSLASHVKNRVDHVKDGQAALDYLFCEGEFAGRDPGLGPRLVLLDINLPKIDGMEVLARVRSDPRTATLPVVVLTSSRSEEHIAQGYALNVNSYIVKPVDLAEFERVVQEIGIGSMLNNDAEVRP